MLCAWKVTRSMQTHALILAESFVLLGLDSYMILGRNTLNELTKEKDKRKLS